MVVQITDPRLIEKTGGIVQGMSGSPIMQDGKLAGAVTHVFVNDPLRAIVFTPSGCTNKPWIKKNNNTKNNKHIYRIIAGNIKI